MDSQTDQCHFILFPFMAQGHMIPMIDIAKMLAQRGVIITIVTTPVNAAQFEPSLAHSRQSGLRINVLQLRFPCVEAGLPEGCENLDKLPSLGLVLNFLTAANMLEPVENLCLELTPSPICIISDVCLPFTSNIARKFGIPRIIFHGGCCFSLLICLKLYTPEVLESIASGSDPIVIPGLPDEIEFAKDQLPLNTDPKLKDLFEQIVAADLASYGVITNTFEELEPAYVKEYRKCREAKVWCIGPVSLCNKDEPDNALRGNNASIDKQQCLDWLDKQKPGSVLYVCLGSQWNLSSLQLIELGQGLEASGRPFIWVIRKASESEDLEKWILREGFAERVQGRGLLIRGWAPQVLILSHTATIGGFLTHCGWNSTLEGITAGVPMMTWPLSGDQFCNEKLVVQCLKIGVRVGVEHPLKWEEEEKMDQELVKKEDVKNALDSLMDGGEEGRRRRERARELGNMAKRAVEEGGSSHLDITQLIQNVMQLEYLRNKQNTSG